MEFGSRGRRLGFLILVGPTLFAGCGDGPANRITESSSGPELVALDSVLLQETEEAYIGNPYTIEVDPYDGSYYVADFFSDRVFRFNPDGTHRMTYGRPGPGPGEFADVGGVFVLNDSVIVADDSRKGVIQLFDRRNGRFLRAVSHTAFVGQNGFIRRGEVMFIAAMNRESRTNVFAWDPRNDSTYGLGSLPDEYLRSFESPGRYWSFYILAALGLRGDTLIFGMSGRNELRRMTADGAIIDTVAPPSVRRRGAPNDVQEYMDEGHIESQQDLFSAASSLLDLHYLEDGSLGVVYRDSHLEGMLPGGLVTSTLWLTVVSADYSQACVDGWVSASDDARPIHTFAGDTLVLLDRRIAANEEYLEAWVVRYRIDTEECDWVPMGG